MQGAPFESELEYLAEGCQGDPLVQSAVLSFKEQTALQVSALLHSTDVLVSVKKTSLKFILYLSRGQHDYIFRV